MNTDPPSNDKPAASAELPQPTPTTEEKPVQLFTPLPYLPEDPIKVSKGYTKVENRIIDLMPDMGPAAWAVYCQLARHADKQGHCWPSIRRMAELTTLDREAVMRAVKRLVKLKLVEVQKTHGKVTHYWLNR